MDAFWMVWSPNGRAPTYRHTSHGEAREEAARLSRLSPGDKFFVLRAEGFVTKTDVTWCPIAAPVVDDDEPPF